MKLKLRDAAVADLDLARRWYRAVDEALVIRFEESVATVFERIVEQPRLFPVVHRDVRRALLKTFPYGVFFRSVGDDLVVVAVLHLRRDPRAARRRR